MGNVSILFSEKDKYYTIHEISALTGLSIREINNAVRSGKIKSVIQRVKNDTRELVVPLNAMEEYITLVRNQDITLL